MTSWKEEISTVLKASLKRVEKPTSVLARPATAGPELIGPRSPFLRADDLGVLRGDGIFERFLVRQGHPRHLDDHLLRLARSAQLVQLDVPPADEWRAAVSCAIDAWDGPVEWEMRLVCTRGPEEGGPPTAYVLGQQLTDRLLRQRQEGVSVVSVLRDLGGRPGVPDAPWLLLGAKTLSYGVNMAAKRYALTRGADDAIFVSGMGGVFEGPTASVVVAFDRRLVSPPADIGILESISTAWLFRAAEKNGWAVARQELALDDLWGADGVWLCSSLNFARVHTLDGKVLGPAPGHQELAALAAGLT